MKNYIVRIYRQNKKKLEGAIGLVEVIESGEVKKFSGLNELFEIFCPKDARTKQKQQKQKHDQ